MLFWCLGVLAILPFCETEITKLNKNYGPYDIIIVEFQEAKGPKQRNLTACKSRLVAQETPQTELNGSCSFLTMATIEEIKVIIYAVNGKINNEIWKQTISNPCRHFMFGVLMQQFVDADTNCAVRRGNYKFHAHFNQMGHVFFGRSFFYGEYLTKFNIYSKMGNIFSANARSLIKKL